MIRAGIATVVALALAGCSQVPGGGDISGVYTGGLENGRDYRLEMSDTLDYRFCRPDDGQCADPEFAGNYEIVKLGARLVIRFELLCIAPDGTCKTYEADAERGKAGAVRLAFEDDGGVRHEFVKQR
ncbi:MAG: hypothetical protein CL807_09255 [Citromicrobium sp.]|nr:hypothetical protein [Citromicrobium sp.]MAO96707.1 hypothetical protein [Citromicrobium sp.]MBD77053.1 hypothetical protein [Citromicrobium sp.]MBT47526.1 hypothetical protein [Citromicrobium sp.]|tara:strand:- start:4607 stop:4987 length:381 start_codon:yes stop_codon:yes gene_type:complete